MLDVLHIALRFALYLDLMLLFGVPLFMLGRTPNRATLVALKPVLLATAILGAGLSVLAMLVMTQQMSDASNWAELQAHLQVMLGETRVGFSLLVRLLTLVFIILTLLYCQRWPRISLCLTVIAAAIALATLTWAGHGVMTEGLPGWGHFLSTIVHLLAAGTWIGALAVFSTLLMRQRLAFNLLLPALQDFTRTGSLVVTLLLATGIANYLFIVGPRLSHLSQTTYNLLLFCKLLMFVFMLGLAALNRYRFTPALERALRQDNPGAASKTLKRSIAIELVCALVILVLIAWLGTLQPLGP